MKVKAYFRTFLGVRMAFLLPLVYLAFLSFGHRWFFLGDTYATAEMFANLFLFTLPIVAGLAAFDTSKVVRPGSLEMFRSAPRSGWLVLLPGLVIAGIAAVGHLLLTAILLALGQTGPPRMGWLPVLIALLTHVLEYLAVAVLATLIALTTVAKLAPVISVVTVFIYLYAAEIIGSGVPIIPFSGAAVPQIWDTWNPQYRTIQIPLLVAAIIVISLAARSLTVAGSNNQRKATAAVVSSGLMMSLCFLMPTTGYKVPVTPVPERELCVEMTTTSGTDLQYCGFREEQRTLQYTRDFALTGYEILEQNQYLPQGYPTKFIAYAPDVDEVLLEDHIQLAVPMAILNEFRIPSEVELTDEVVFELANVLALPPQCMSTPAQDAIAASPDSMRMEQIYDLVNSVHALASALEPPLSATEFKTVYGELASWCAGQ